MNSSRKGLHRIICMVVVSAGLVLAMSLSADAKGKAKHAGLSGKFVSFADHALILEISKNQFETFNVPDRIPIEIVKKPSEKSMSPGAFDGVPKGTKIEVAVDGQGDVTSAKILHPNYKKR